MITGKLSIEPMELECIAQIKVKIKSNDPFAGFFNDPFGQFSMGYQEVKKEIKSNPLTFSVSDLPSTNKPDDFSGFVGSLTMETKLDKHEVKANEAIKVGGEATTAAVLTAISQLDKAAGKGVIHKNNAARRKSRLMKALAAVAAK